LGTSFSTLNIPKRVFAVAAICSAIPDLDVIGFRFGVKYGDFWGHRGFTHSLAFAALLAVLVVFVLFHRIDGISRFNLTTYIFLATASHGLLDAMTNGGLGIAFFSPFDTNRYFLPWRPIRVAPVSPLRFFTARGFSILYSEMLWVWVPAITFSAVVLLVKRVRMAKQPEAGN
jgi:inner membrane protein